MEKLKKSSSLKMMCYILIPFIVLELIVAITYFNSYYFYRDIENLFRIPIVVCIYIPMLVLGIIAIYLFYAIGKKNEKGEVELNQYDKIPYEIILVITLVVLYFGVQTMMYWTYMSARIVEYIIAIVSYFVTYIACATFGITSIKRVKSNTLLTNTLIYRFFKWLKKECIAINQKFTWNEKISKKFVVYYSIFIFISCILGFLTIIGNIFFAPFLLFFWIWVGYKIMVYMMQTNDVQKYIKSVYEGNNNIKLNKDNYEANLKQMIIYIENISNGFSKAIEESVKSERMKTELITNVSHDIKTPLTSIINYVDLMKKENIKNKKVKEYLDILDQKSQRLKRLTEDLVEASKASSGNLKLNIEKINVKELINQVSGEFEDKFKENKLELILDMPKEDVTIEADSRYMYRIIENMYNNISKYALEGSRVYVDLLKEDNKTRIELKNISKDKLNITADELMQRFVRGEKSRNTEGSGLGLSIAESLTKIQGGEFKIYLDGDLFKVIIEFVHII